MPEGPGPVNGNQPPHRHLGEQGKHHHPPDRPAGPQHKTGDDVEDDDKYDRYDVADQSVAHPPAVHFDEILWQPGHVGEILSRPKHDSSRARVWRREKGAVLLTGAERSAVWVWRLENRRHHKNKPALPPIATLPKSLPADTGETDRCKERRGQLTNRKSRPR